MSIRFKLLSLALHVVLAPAALAGLAFPRVEAVEDAGRMVDRYKAYLDFAVDAAQATHPAKADRLAKTYSDLRDTSEMDAARFLKGMRFELQQKLEFMGANPARMHSRHPQMVKMASRYADTWIQEAEEHLFRARTSQFAKK